MKVFQKTLKTIPELESLNLDFNPDIFFIFMSSTFNDKNLFLKTINLKFPNAIKFGCSTAGEILGNHVYDDTVALTAVHFEKTEIKLEEIDLNDFEDSYNSGIELFKKLKKDDLKHIIVLSDGLNADGSELVKGLNRNSHDSINITGGLAADGTNFKETFLISTKEIKSKKVLGLGFYGENIKIGFGSKGGWDSFGIERLVTRSNNNILYELDGQPALELYKSFFKDRAKGLPNSLLFPLSMRNEANQIPVVRTILDVDEKEQSLIIAGNMEQGSYVRLMKANIGRLIHGAQQSAEISQNDAKEDCQLALLISCVGRKLILKHMIEDEIEAVNEVIGEQAYTSGFYSYGEIAPFNTSTPSILHNQTMTITTFTE